MISYGTTLDGALLREVHRTLLAPSFRASELIPEDEFVAQFGRSADAVIARDGTSPVGVAVVEHLEGAVLLQYLVSAPQSRGLGIGSGLMSAVIEEWATESLLLAEFDRPDVQAPHPLQGDPVARLRLYARFGALALDLPYFQPPVATSSPREHGMLLAVFDVDGSIAAHGRLGSSQLVAVRRYLDEALGEADDPDARRLRAAAAVADGPRALPLDRFAEIERSPL